MQQIQVEMALGEKLAMQKGQVVLVDQQGRALGYFSPMREPTRLNDLELEPPTSIEESEELRKRARANPGRPLKDILNELGY
jgi:hypothetical protein